MKIGFIGTGSFARQHADVLQSIGATIVACYGTNAKKTAQFASEFNCKSFPHPEAFIHHKYIDALYIVIPPFAHDGQVEINAIANNIPFFCEKPVALELAVCEKITTPLKRSALITSSGYLLRYEPIFTQIKNILQRNVISTVRICSYSYMPQVHWWRKEDKSGGMMLEAGSHYIDLLRFLFAEISSVSAVKSKGIAAQHIAECDIYDSMEATLTFTNGMIGSIGVTHLLNNIKARHDRMEIHGLDFAMHIDLYKLRYQQEGYAIYKEPHHDAWIKIEGASSKKELLTLENQAFLQAVQEQNATRVKSDYLDAVKTLKVALAMNASSVSRKFIDID